MDIEESQEAFPISNLLSKAYQSPRDMKSEIILGKKNSASIVVLALHVIFSELGLCALKNETQLDSEIDITYKPPRGWNRGSPEDWTLIYKLKGFDSVYKIYLSQLPNQDRMFVYAFEVDNSRNIQRLGLSVNNYIPPDISLDQDQWYNIINEEDTLYKFLWDYIVSPLMENSMDGIFKDGMLLANKNTPQDQITRIGNKGNLKEATPNKESSNPKSYAQAAKQKIAMNEPQNINQNILQVESPILNSQNGNQNYSRKQQNDQNEQDANSQNLIQTSQELIQNSKSLLQENEIDQRLEELSSQYRLLDMETQERQQLVEYLIQNNIVDTEYEKELRDRNVLENLIQQVDKGQHPFSKDVQENYRINKSSQASKSVLQPDKLLNLDSFQSTDYDLLQKNLSQRKYQDPTNQLANDSSYFSADAQLSAELSSLLYDNQQANTQQQDLGKILELELSAGNILSYEQLQQNDNLKAARHKNDKYPKHTQGELDILQEDTADEDQLNYERNLFDIINQQFSDPENIPYNFEEQSQPVQDLVQSFQQSMKSKGNQVSSQALIQQVQNLVKQKVKDYNQESSEIMPTLSSPQTNGYSQSQRSYNRSLSQQQAQQQQAEQQQRIQELLSKDNLRKEGSIQKSLQQEVFTKQGSQSLSKEASLQSGPIAQNLSQTSDLFKAFNKLEDQQSSSAQDRFQQLNEKVDNEISSTIINSQNTLDSNKYQELSKEKDNSLTNEQTGGFYRQWLDSLNSMTDCLSQIDGNTWVAIGTVVGALGALSAVYYTQTIARKTG